MHERVIFSPEATADFRYIVAWHRQPGADTAERRRLARLVAAIETLAESPHHGRLIGEGLSRIAVSEHHRIIYQLQLVDGLSTVAVVRILGPGQDY